MLLPLAYMVYMAKFIEGSDVDRYSGLNSSQTSMLGSTALGTYSQFRGWVNLLG